jgi:flagellar biosynthesis anti-sigma factor FlgM
MKIDPNGITPVSPKKTEAVQSVGKSDSLAETQPVMGSKDRVEVTGSARLMAKARVALENTGAAENTRVETLRQQIQAGTYQIPVDELAKRLLDRMGGK